MSEATNANDYSVLLHSDRRDADERCRSVVISAFDWKRQVDNRIKDTRTQHSVEDSRMHGENCFCTRCHRARREETGRHVFK